MVTYLAGGWPTSIYKWMMWMVYSGKYHWILDDDWEILVGGIPTPLKNDGVKVSWDEIPIWKVIKAMFQTTNQNMMLCQIWCKALEHAYFSGSMVIYQKVIPIHHHCSPLNHHSITVYDWDITWYYPMFRHAQLCLAARWAVTAGPVARTLWLGYYMVLPHV